MSIRHKSTGKDAQQSNQNYKTIQVWGRTFKNPKTLKAKSGELRIGGHPGLYSKTPPVKKTDNKNLTYN